MPEIVEDEPAFAAMLGPQMTSAVEHVAKAMCSYSAEDEEDGRPCTCATDGGSCVAFGLYGHLAHVAILAMQKGGHKPVGTLDGDGYLPRIITDKLPINT